MSCILGLRVETFIGGLRIEDDIERAKSCHVAVGAPGRLRHLIDKKALCTKHVRLLIFDEADKLMEEAFSDDVEAIFQSFPVQKQVLASSATYPDDLEDFLQSYMNTPTHISPDIDTPLLLGLRQFVSIVQCSKNVIQMMNVKTTELNRILTQVPFTQCLVFSNYQTRVESISNTLNRLGWTTTFISSAQKQSVRLETIGQLKNFQQRILLTTDLTSRGIDIANIDLVINYDMPFDTSTYLHRMGRAGRFGTRGITITITSEEEELPILKHILAEIGGTTLSINILPENFNSDLIRNAESTFEQLRGEFLPNAVQEHKQIIDSILDMKSNKKKKKKQQKKKREENDRDNSENVNKSLNTNEKSNGDFDLMHVKSFLENHKKDEEHVKEILNNEDASSILEALANNTFEDHKIEVIVTPIDDGNNVKELLNNSCINIENSEQPEELRTKKRKRISNSNNTKKFLYEKNVSLLHLTKLLIGTYNNTSIPEEVVNHIKNLLTQLKVIEDELKKNYTDINLDNISNYLEEVDEEVEEQEQERDIEDIFKISYDYAINSSTLHWSSFMEKEKVSISSVTKKHKKNNHVKINAHTSNENDSLFFSNDDSEEYEEDDYNEENYIEDAEYLENNQNEYNNSVVNEDFVNIYKQHKSKLLEFIENCNDVENFNEFYKYWQEQLKATTDYVQQNIYLDVMNNYRYYKQSNCN